MSDLTERAIQLALYRDLRSAIVCAAPNYTPANWWECDLWAVTKAGYAVEHEIKLTVSDFRADAAKTERRWHPDPSQMGVRHKHTLLAQRSEDGPSRFFYVFPDGLAIEPEAVPDWAGIKRARVVERRGYMPETAIKIERPAPQLHKRKVGTREIRLCQRRMWFRYWDTLGDIHRMVKEFANG